MALSQPNSGTYLPTATGSYTTLVTDTTLGLKQFGIDLTNLPAGTILFLSFQTILTSGGTTYQEFDNATLSVPVATPAAPSAGYQPLHFFKWDTSLSGFQVQAQIVSGTLPSTALNWVENAVS